MDRRRLLRDALAAGLVPSLACRGGSLTGLAWQASELVTTQLQLLRELEPGGPSGLSSSRTRRTRSACRPDPRRRASVLLVLAEFVAERRRLSELAEPIASRPVFEVKATPRRVIIERPTAAAPRAPREGAAAVPRRLAVKVRPMNCPPTIHISCG
jgi:hypothetical protein